MVSYQKSFLSNLGRYSDLQSILDASLYESKKYPKAKWKPFVCSER